MGISRKRKLAGLLGAVIATVAISTQAYAVPVLDFGTGSAGPGGTITSLGGGNYSGAGIPVDVLTVTGAPGAGVYDTSGAFASGTAVGGTSAVLAFNTVAGTISITGGVPFFGIGPAAPLLSGSFSSFSGTSCGTSCLYFTGVGPDVKDPDLLTALGLSPTLPFEFFGFTISADFSGTTGTGHAISTDIVNTAVPEPATLLLLGSGLVSLGWFGRKRLKNDDDPKA
jgi:hypothetical protein